MTLAFGVFMCEALLAYAAPMVESWTRPQRKRVHYSCHAAAGVCMLFGLLAAFQSHNLKLPVPMPNLYSAHSLLGMFCVLLFASQFGFGIVAYLYPQLSLPFRQSLAPLHKFVGMATWVCGLAAMATGLQEKATFTQTGKSLAGDALHSGVMRIPAIAVVLLALLGITVLYHQVVPVPAPPHAGATAEEGRALLSGAPST
ncbi:hypothetical protein FOA52_004358 [Chlamydomonas sp. UWO 241]|nr:hypothetical protein FOA52_004358 [Chlamydomonas sp. UWO 241]